MVSSFSTKYVKVLLFRFFSPLRHFFLFDGVTWSQLDLFLSRKVLLNFSLLLRSCDFWLEVALGRFSLLFWEELATNNCFFRSVCANMLPVRAKCRADVQLASLYRSCVSKDQTSRNGNIWSHVLSVSSKEVFPPKKMDGSVMKDARGACASCCRMSLGATDSEKKKATDDCDNESNTHLRLGGQPQDFGKCVSAVQDQTARTKLMNILTDSHPCRW